MMVVALIMPVVWPVVCLRLCSERACVQTGRHGAGTHAHSGLSRSAPCTVVLSGMCLWQQIMFIGGNHVHTSTRRLRLRRSAHCTASQALHRPS